MVAKAPRRLLGACALAVLLLTFLPAAAVEASTAPPASYIRTGTRLEAGSELVSANHKYRFVMQTDGNLVLYEGTVALWDSGTEGHPGAFAILQLDGNFVVYVGQHALWSSRTNFPGGSKNRLRVENSGYVAIYQGDENYWTTIPLLQEGSAGHWVTQLQDELNGLGYWVGPADGYFGDSTQQAVWALQKTAHLETTGIVDAATWDALDHGLRPTPRPASGNLIEVNLQLDLVMIIRNGKLAYTLNTSTGGGYTYVEDGETDTAITPQGVFATYSEIDGTDTDPLGTLWRPKFFYEGYAIHGDSYVPPFPVSHGCVRVSNEAIDWIWAENLDPIGEEVWVYY